MRRLVFYIAMIFTAYFLQIGVFTNLTLGWHRAESAGYMHGIDRYDPWKKRRVSDRIFLRYSDGCPVYHIFRLLWADSGGHRLYGRLCSADFL